MKVKKPKCQTCECRDHAWARTTQWGTALVSIEDSHWLESFSWCLLVPKQGYAYARSAHSLVNSTLHVAIMPNVEMVDHKNGNGLDCRRINIRKASRGQNRINVKTEPRARSGYRGVFFNTSGRGPKWKSGIRINKITKHLGYFDDPEQAARVYDLAAHAAFGEFARLNFPIVADF